MIEIEEALHALSVAREYAEEGNYAACAAVVEKLIGMFPSSCRFGRDVAAMWLCDMLRVAPESLGWSTKETPAASGTITPKPKRQSVFFRASRWGDAEPPQREWVVDGLVPRKTVTSLYGDGAGNGHRVSHCANQPGEYYLEADIEAAPGTLTDTEMQEVHQMLVTAKDCLRAVGVELAHLAHV